ncbi:MAG: gliding motility-associated C-terminal domain-containing protein [Spirosomataceae bacterium]
MNRLITCGLLLIWSAGAWARHITGGEISLSKRGNTAGDFTLTLTLLYDDVLGTTDDKAFVSLFRKSNDARLEDFSLTRVLKQELPYTNARCVSNAPASRITLVRYSADISLPPGTYNAPEGYYLAWEECCRNGNIINLQNPAKVGLAFYAEIPPVSVRNSTPAFTTPEIKYVCVGKKAEIDFSATDADGDELRYSFVTPLIGSTDGGGTFPTKAKQGPYNRAVWNSGFDSTHVIPGKEPLQLTAETGKLTLTATQLGTFALAVRCEEFRNGVKIGEIRREFVLNVADCLSETPAPVTVAIKQATSSVTFETQPNGHINSVKLCKGDSALLKADDEDPKWAYQWQLNGQYLPGANKSFLAIRQAGTYSVVKRFAQSCSIEDSTANTFTVISKDTPTAKILSSRPLPLCDSDSTNLSLAPGTTGQFRWQRNGQPVGNQSNTLPFVKLPGTYSVFVTDESTKCVAKDSLIIRQVIGPPASLSLIGTPISCSNDSVKLITQKNNAYEYVWYSADFPLVQAIENEFYPQKSGKYSVSVVDTATKCATRSAVYDLVVKPSPVVMLDSIAPLCTSGLQAVLLAGTPAGGTFTGRGVAGNRFITQNLTAGSYPITYTYVNADGCSGKDTQIARISPPPRLELPKELVVFKGDSITMKTSVPPNSSVRWFPSIGLNDPLSALPHAAPDRTTTYKITVTNEQGCVVQGEVTVIVIDLTIPNGFTPNDDGTNDTWEIAGIREYPNCTVEIFNRWGNVIYSNKGYETPWDGKWNGETVPVGTYYYQIYLREVEYKLTGSLNVIR